MTKRSERTRESIRDALLSLLGSWELNDITMSQLARTAGISRSSLYSHYRNVREVFDDCVEGFCSGLRPLTAQLRCGGCEGAMEGESEDDEPDASDVCVDGASSGDAGALEWRDLPFCIALRNAGKYEPLVRDANFLPTMLASMDSQLLDDSKGYPMDEELDARRKRALLRFQMSGCYAVAMDADAGEDWVPIQRMLDSYIRAGSSEARMIRN